MEAIIEPLRLVDWDDAAAVEHSCRQALAALTQDPETIRKVLADLPSRPDLLELSEHHEFFDKILLYDDAEYGLRLRLHVFLPGFCDPPHNHRWSFASMILHGGYRHALFGDVAQVMRQDPAALRALLVRHEQAGCVYALHHDMVHCVESEPYTVSLVLRGPPVSDRHVVMDPAAGPTWWQRGRSPQAAQAPVSAQMSLGRLAELTGWLAAWGLF